MRPMGTLTIPAMTKKELIYDKLMVPVMFILRGFRADSLQETHVWHPYEIDARKIDLGMAVKNQGHDPSRFKQGKAKFLFHAPVFGGWKEFSVYAVDETETPFYVGWIVYSALDNELIAAHVHRLPINTDRIRLLDGNSITWGYFFAIDSKGNQIPLKKVGSGKIGDGTYKEVRIF